MKPPQYISPWIHQLDRKRPLMTVNSDLSSEVAVLGAGIAGSMTAYFLLKKTKKKILLIDGGRVAHGATGHNAGQLVSYFERPFFDIVHEYGLKMASAGQKDVESAWDLLAQIIKKEKLETACYLFTGYAGCVDLEELIHHLENNHLRHQAGLSTEVIWVSRSFSDRMRIPTHYRSYYKIVTADRILRALQTRDHAYVAAIQGKKGCMNSAALCEELVSKMLRRFPDRFQLVENFPIHTLQLSADQAVLYGTSFTVSAERVVLCTNGFERLTIKNQMGMEIDRKFHHLVRGSVGYMAAFLETAPFPPTAISYFPPSTSTGHGAYDTEPYYYLTRRPHDIFQGKQRNLICIGGPESLMDDTNRYHHAHPYPKEARLSISRFLRRVYPYLKSRWSYTYFWHGLMGYTPNGLRCVGFEPCNPVLLYNLGCNGVGILPSIMGGNRIARLLRGDKLVPSIFDPQDQRCERSSRVQPSSWWSRIFHTNNRFAKIMHASSWVALVSSAVLAMIVLTPINTARSFIQTLEEHFY